MHAFGVAHILWLSGIAATAAVLAELVRRQRVPPRLVRGGLALFLVGGELQRYFHDGMKWPDGLPLQICNVTTWLAVFACITMAPWAAEFVYFSGFSATALALLSPDMGAQWPPRFFVNHGIIIVTAAVLVFGRMVRVRPGAIWRAYAILVGYGAFVGAFNWATQTNYAYLCRKPGSNTLMNFMGPWPVYLFSIALLALFLFWMLGLVAPGRTAPSEAGFPANVASTGGREIYGRPESSF